MQQNYIMQYNKIQLRSLKEHGCSFNKTYTYLMKQNKYIQQKKCKSPALVLAHACNRMPLAQTQGDARAIAFCAHALALALFSVPFFVLYVYFIFTLWKKGLRYNARHHCFCNGMLSRV